MLTIALGSLVLSKSTDVSIISPRFRHSATYIGSYPGSNNRKDFSQVLVIGGTGETRESTFGDTFVIEVEDGTHSFANKLVSVTKNCLDGLMKRFKPGQNTWKSYLSNDSWAGMLTAYAAEPIEGKPSDYLSTRHTASYVDDKVWIWGGSKGFPPEKSNHMICFDIATKKWTKIEPFNSVPPSARSDHSAAVVGKDIYIFGGSDKCVTPLNDLHVFNVETRTWRQIPHKGTPPSPRSGHTMVSIGNKIYVYGGAKWNSCQNTWTDKSSDLYMLDTETLVWTKLQVYGNKPKVATFVATWAMGHHIWILGGGRTEEDFVSDTCHCFDTITRTWTTCEFIGETFVGKDCVSATVVGSNVMLFGGYRGDPVNSLQFIDMVWASRMKKFGFSL